MLGLFSHNLASPWVKANPDIWAILERAGEARSYPANFSIYCQGEQTTSFFYLKSGRVKVYITSPDGGEKTLAIHEIGSLFGETSAFDGHPRLASAKTMVSSEIISLHSSCLLSLFQAKPEIALNMLQSLTQKIRLLTLQVESMAFLEADKKVANLLLRLATDFGVHTPEGIALSVRCTHEDIASLIGSCRVTVTKVLNKLVKKGIIVNKYGRLTIIKSTQLAALAEADANVRSNLSER